MPTRLKIRYALFAICGALWAPVFYRVYDGTWQSSAMLFIGGVVVSMFLMLAITRLTRAKKQH